MNKTLTLDDGEDEHELPWLVSVTRVLDAARAKEKRTMMSITMNTSLIHPKIYSSSPKTCTGRVNTEDSLVGGDHVVECPPSAQDGRHVPGQGTC